MILNMRLNTLYMLRINLSYQLKITIKHQNIYSKWIRLYLILQLRKTANILDRLCFIDVVELYSITISCYLNLLCIQFYKYSIKQLNKVRLRTWINTLCKSKLQWYQSYKKDSRLFSENFYQTPYLQWPLPLLLPPALSLPLPKIYLLILYLPSIIWSQLNSPVTITYYGKLKLFHTWKDNTSSALSMEPNLYLLNFFLWPPLKQALPVQIPTFYYGNPKTNWF